MVYAIFKPMAGVGSGSRNTNSVSKTKLLMAGQVDEWFSSVWRSAQQQLNRLLVQSLSLGEKKSAATCCWYLLLPSSGIRKIDL